MFKKSTYSDLEVQEILQTLFNEKKKVSELENKLKSSSVSTQPYRSEEVEKLKIECDHLRAKYREAQETFIREKETLKLEKNPTIDEAQFENIVQFLRKKAEDVLAENQQLLKKITFQEEEQKKLQIELVQLKQTYDGILEVLQLERTQKSELKAEEEALKVQMTQLKSHYAKQDEILKNTENEKKEFQNKLIEKETAYLHAEQELELVKQMMMKALQEEREKRDQEREETEKKFAQLKNQLEKDQKELHETQNQLREKQKINQALTESLNQADLQATTLREVTQSASELKQKLLQAEEQKQNLLESSTLKEQLITQLQSQLEQVTRSLTFANEAIQQAETEHTENESRLRVSQQHLAKKVREASTLSEKNEELKVRLQELEHILESTKGKLFEAQASLETHTKHEKALQEQYQESLKVAESHAKTWEVKYFQMQEKWQEAEAKNRELKRVEERFIKLQQVMIHLNSVLGSSLSIPSLDLNAAEVTQPVKISEQVTMPKVTIQSSLFEASKQSGRFKETLFG